MLLPTSVLSRYRMGPPGVPASPAASTSDQPQVILIMHRRHHRGPMLINGNFGWGMWEWIWQRG